MEQHMVDPFDALRESARSAELPAARAREVRRRDAIFPWLLSLAVTLPIAVIAIGIERAVAIGASPLVQTSAARADRGFEDDSAKGAFTCDFTLGPTAFEANLPAAIERDRMYMTAQPGMRHKHIPFRPDPAAAADGGAAYSGGRYLFDTAKQARDYEQFVTRRFTLDGTQFLHRDYFKNPSCHSWEVLGAHSFASIDHQLVMRTEWLHVVGDHTTDVLHDRWPTVRATAKALGYTAVWLLWQPESNLVGLVYFTDRTLSDPAPLDLPGLGSLEAARPLGDVFADQPWIRSFDRTEWALTIWFPFAPGDHGLPSIWPYSAFPSPERPRPDGLCEPSRGESYGTAPNECLPTCGDGIEQRDRGETTQTCPSDVPWTDPP